MANLKGGEIGPGSNLGARGVERDTFKYLNKPYL